MTGCESVASCLPAVEPDSPNHVQAVAQATENSFDGPKGGLASLAGALPDAEDFLGALNGQDRLGKRPVPELKSVWVSYLFDTDALSEVWRPRPLQAYMRWLEAIPLESQYASAVTLGERYTGAYRSANSARYLTYIEERLLPNVTVLPYDPAVAKVFGSVRAALEVQGRILEDSDLQIAATAIHHGLELVT